MKSHQIRQPEFEALIKKYQGIVFSVAFSILLNPQESLDVVQNTFLKAFLQPGFTEEAFDQKNWLIRVVRNDALNKKKSWWRKLKLMADFHEFDQQGIAPELVDLFAREQRVERLKEALQQLSDNEREIVALRFAAGYTYEQIAGQLGIKIGTVMSRLARVKEKIAGIMGDGYCD